jgi:C4-dicarboxylate-binding protein DctP
MLRSLRLWLFAASFFLAPVALAQPVVMRVSHQVPPAHHLSKLLQEFADEVKARTNGTVDVQLFGSEQLAKAGENFPQVARGNIEAAVSVNFQWGATIPEMSVTLIPYYMTDLEKIKRFTTSDARKLLDEKLEAHGVHSVGWFYITRQSIFTSGKKPIVTLDDFKGLKIRGLNSLTDHALTAVGAAPSAMPGSEVYQALQAGVLDAGLTDLSAAYSRKYYDIQKYGTVAPYFTVFFHLYVNPQWWSKLTPAQRQAIDAAAAKIEQDAFTVTEATAADALVQLKAKGMQIHVQTPEEEATWRAAMQKPVLDAFLKSAPQDGRKILDLVNKL